MRKLTFVLGALSLVLVGVGACSSDESSVPPAGTAGSAGSAGSAGASGGKCANSADEAALEADYDAGKVSNVAGKCAVGCLSSDSGMCVEDCVVAATGISHGCASCVAASADCSKKQCLTECIADPGSAKCAICQCGLQQGKPINCLDAYETCSGIPNTVCGNIPEAGTDDAPAEAAEEAATEAGEEAATEAAADVSADVVAE
jgi:hypothetical protein